MGSFWNVTSYILVHRGQHFIETVRMFNVQSFACGNLSAGIFLLINTEL